PGIDFVDVSNVSDTDGIFIGQQQVTGVGIPGHPSQTGGSNGASTIAARRGLATEGPQGLVDDRSVMARNSVGGTDRCDAAQTRKTEHRIIIDWTSGDTTENVGVGGIRAGECDVDGI